MVLVSPRSNPTLHKTGMSIAKLSNAMGHDTGKDADKGSGALTPMS